ncbi:hypothetical protein FQR65_LT18458 [Abscondita terminalis]|nr:hypothetical protein FQR65_LT18458 [Abscondita terminalis]
MSCKGRGGTWCMVPNCTSNTKEKLSVSLDCQKNLKGEDSYDIDKETSDASLFEEFIVSAGEEEEGEEEQDSTDYIPLDAYQSDE